MINQKGQAFSVFELMIAGVVAFAILMVLMQVIGGVLTGQDTDALSAISDAVKSANPSGEQPIGNFVLKKNTAIDQSDMALATDLDAESFIFVMGGLTATDIDVGDGTYIKYVGTQQKQTFAGIVICKPTPDGMSKALERLAAPLDGIDVTCSENVVCCVVIPTKRTS